MQYQILQKPEFSLIKVTFDGQGDSVLVEPSAMVAKDTSVDMKTQMQGGFMAAMKRKLLGGESIFQNTFTAVQPGQTLYLAPGPEGDVEVVQCDGSTPIFLSSGAFLASSPNVKLDTKWAGAKGFFSGAGMFLLKAEGVGPLFFCAYGGIHAVDVGQYGGGYIVDNNHVVGWQGGLDYKVRSLGGLKSLFASGEGLVCEFRGQGKLWLSTRNPNSLAAFIQPFRRIARKAQGSGE